MVHIILVLYEMSKYFGYIKWNILNEHDYTTKKDI